MTAADLMRLPLITKRGRGGEVSRTEEALRHLETQGLKLNIVLQCDSGQSVMAAVKAGMGLGILYADVVASELKSGKLKLVKIPDLRLYVQSFVVYHKEKPLSPTAQEFLALLRESRKNLE